MVWGRRGVAQGRLQKPRALAIDGADHLYIVDMTARIQVFDTDGNYLRGWRTPTCQNGRPSGLSMGRDGLLLVADTHYFRMLCYTPDGQLLADRTIGGTPGREPGQFGFVTDAAQDSHGNIYIAEYGTHDRVQKFSPTGKFLLEWGAHGAQPGQFVRPQNLAIDRLDQIWVADACNHRIQVFDSRGRLLRCWGMPGRAPGALYYPYDLALDHRGHLYVCEFGNHRVQKFTLEGRSLGCWGSNGRGDGQLHNPWGLVCDRQGRVHVLDTNNHRVQRIRL
jgi:sugar lactone lactonase YvrE